MLPDDVISPQYGETENYGIPFEWVGVYETQDGVAQHHQNVSQDFSVTASAYDDRRTTQGSIPSSAL
jgi:hypothetical protein